MFQKVAQPNKSGDRGKKCFAKGKSISQWQRSDPGAFSSQISDASIKSYPEKRTVAIACTLPVCIIYLHVIHDCNAYPDNKYCLRGTAAPVCRPNAL